MEQPARNQRKLKEGVVVSNKMDSTVRVEVVSTIKHPRYGKTIKRKTVCYAHTDKPLENGDRVTIMETKPISKLKRWRVVA
jgi:small subunit ribosomal protein S17